MVRTIDWAGDHVVIIDQTRLPGELVRLELRTVDEIVDAIRRLAVRGAPAIGVAGGLGVALAALPDPASAPAAAGRLRAARPTAVNLAWAVDRVLARLPEGVDRLVAVAPGLLEEEVATNGALAARGADWVQARLPGAVSVHTHCNAGGLACVEWGTALGVVRALHERGAVREVFAGETRPLLQGARLTAYELDLLGIPHRVVVDGAGPSLIARGLVDVVIVGADRIAANGDVANKIGTFPLALAADRAGVPFVVAAPESTLDPATPTGEAITIEERDPTEVTTFAPAYNPAFDVTPHDLVTAIITERRVVEP